MPTSKVPPTPLCVGRPLPRGVTIEHVLVTPEVAAEMLSHNTRNRNEKPAYKIRYVDDMLAGNWAWTGEPLRFDLDGVLLDGQNRLQALIEAGVSLMFLVIRGLPPEAQDDMDTGAPRRFGDVLALNGEPNAAALAALVRRAAAWERGARRNLQGTVTSFHALRRVLADHPELREILIPARKVANGSGLSQSVAGLAMWLFQRIDAEDAEVFFERLQDGASLAKGDPVFELRRTLHESKATVRGERSETWMLAITIKAWNAYRLGETVGLYRWRPGGAKPEKFPEPI